MLPARGSQALPVPGHQRHADQPPSTPDPWWGTDAAIAALLLLLSPLDTLPSRWGCLGEEPPANPRVWLLGHAPWRRADRRGREQGRVWEAGSGREAAVNGPGF